MKDFGWCFIGTGVLAKQVAEALNKTGGHKIVSVYTRRFEKGKEFAAEFGGVAYDDVTAAITAEGVDGVYIVTPHTSHYEYTKKAIELGKPVLCEKPFTTDAVKAKELFALAEEKGVYVVEAMWTWFSPIARQVKKWLDEGAFGEILDVKTNYHLNVRNYAPRMTDPNCAGGALLDSSIYPLTYLYRLFGKPVKAVCQGMIEDGVDLKNEIDLTFENGITRHISVSIIDNEGLEKVEIKGTEAEMCLLAFHSTNEVELKKQNGETEVLKADGSLVNEFNLVKQEILAGKKASDYVPPEATLDVLEIIDDCRQQIGLVYPFEK